MGNFCWKMETFLNCLKISKFFGYLPGKIDFLQNFLKNRNVSEICLEKSNIFDPDPRPPDFKADSVRVPEQILHPQNHSHPASSIFCHMVVFALMTFERRVISNAVVLHSAAFNPPSRMEEWTSTHSGHLCQVSCRRP